MARDKKANKNPFTKIVDETIKLADKSGNGILNMQASVDKEGKLRRYSLTYINHHICSLDNGRVLGYDNSHGYHHRHYMGKEEPIEFVSYEEIAERFEREWRILHEQIKNDYH